MRRKIILSIILVLIITISIIIFSKDKEEIQMTQEENSASFISMMLEQDAGSSNYVENIDIKFPLEGYHFNSEESGCENGGILSWNSEKQKVEASLLTSDKCYAYFDNVQVKSDFSYTGDYEEYIVPSTGTYKIELWGASGGFSDYSFGGTAQIPSGGKGAYVKGNIYLKKGEKLYIYVGEYPSYFSGNCYSTNPNTAFNGSKGGSCASGGGATDIRLIAGDWDNFEGLKSRIMVAAGGGAAVYGGKGGDGGTINGLDGEGVGTYPGISDIRSGKGATQETYYFGRSSGNSSPCGSGSGYYGGDGGVVGNAGGGSSFISGYPGCNAIAENSTEDAIIHTGQPNHYSGKVFTDYEMIAGNAMMPSPDGGTEEGHTGNGYAKITLVK